MLSMSSQIIMIFYCTNCPEIFRESGRVGCFQEVRRENLNSCEKQNCFLRLHPRDKKAMHIGVARIFQRRGGGGGGGSHCVKQGTRVFAT